MKKVLGVIVALFLCSSVFSQGIEFQHISFNEALAKAKKENKMVFMDCYTTWCGPCKTLATKIFPQEVVGDYYNANYVCLKIDMEKGEGPELSKRYKVHEFPTLLFIDRNGKVVSKRIGRTDAAGLINDGKVAKDPNEGLEVIQAKYVAGDRSKALVVKYITLLQKNYLRKELIKVGGEYLKSLSNEDLFNPEHFNTLRIVGAPFESEKFQYVYTNKEKFVKEVGQEAVNSLIRSTFYVYLQVVAGAKDVDKLKSVIAEHQKLFPDSKNENFYGKLYAKHYLNNAKFKEWFELTDEKIKKAKEEGDKVYAETLVKSAYGIVRNAKFSGKPDSYDKAISWVKTAIERDADVKGANMCLANLYQKKGDKSNALMYLKIYEEKNPSLSEREEKYFKSLKLQVEKMQ